MPRVNSLAPAALAAAALFLPSTRGGDLLRGGAPMGSTHRAATGGNNAGGASAAAAQAVARDRLSRTTRALDSMVALQTAARAAAGRPRRDFPVIRDGLGKNGLQLAPGVPKDLAHPGKGEDRGLWTGADLPTQTKSGDRTNVTIVQTRQQALLNWTTFDVGAKTTLTFDQGAGGRDSGKWIAFNKIDDPSGRPSQILGSIQADGQVYVLNQNGIIFGGASQVNVHALVASALPIDGNLISRGLIDNPAAQFLFSAPRTELLAGLTAATPVVSLLRVVDERSTPKVTASLTRKTPAGGSENLSVDLVPGRDYTLVTRANRRSTLTLTAAGLAKTQGPEITATTYRASYVELNGDIVVDRGARLESPTSPAKVGGRIMLAGANVANAGTISTPDGQAILAAGLQVGIDAHKSSDPSIRGLDVYVGKVFDPDTMTGDFAGTATNSGLIQAPRANATLTGRSVGQLGVIDGSTSVSLNGSITLAANYDATRNSNYDPSDPAKGAIFNYRSTGAITLGDGSVTRILPESASSESRTELGHASLMTLAGRTIHLETGATILAPNADVTAQAGNWLFLPSSGAGAPTSEFVYTGGQIYLDRGAVIDVAGSTGALSPLSQNILQLQLRGAELSDSPLQRTGPLRATDLVVDLRNHGRSLGRDWLGTPLADVSGYAKLIERTVAELTTAGGTVDLRAGGSVVLQKGSAVDVSGGWVRYRSGLVETSRVWSGNRLIDIANATPDLVYDGLYTAKFLLVQPKWGISTTFANPLSLGNRHFERNYVAGDDGGRIAITAPAMALDGRLSGNTTAGPRQLRDAGGASDLPAASRLALVFQSQIPSQIDPHITLTVSPHAPRVVFGDDPGQPAAGPFRLDAFGDPRDLPAAREKLVMISPDLVDRDGFGSLAIDDSSGRIDLPASVSLDFAPGAPGDPALANLDLQALRIDVGGDIVAPGGSLKFTVYSYSKSDFNLLASTTPPEDLPAPEPDPRSGNFVLRPGAILSTAGLVVDDRPASAAPRAQPLQPGGGSIDIDAFGVQLARGGALDVSGGATMGPTGKIAFGDAGRIQLAAGQDPDLASLLGGRLDLGATLLGYSGARGGALSIQAPLIRIGDAAPDAGTLAISPDFFDQGGFATFSLAGLGALPRHPARADNVLPGLVVLPATIIDPAVRSWQAIPLMAGTGAFSLESILLPVGLRAPVSLSFSARGVKDAFTSNLVFRGDLQLGQGAEILAGPRGAVSLKGDTVSVMGAVHAPGGTIDVTGADAFPQISGTPTFARTTLYLGPASVLDASGAVVRVPDDFGFRKGDVLPGGDVSLGGNILAMAAARIDVSGASGTLDLTPGEAGLSSAVPATSGLTGMLARRVVAPTRVDSDGGTITLAGRQQLFVDSDLRGAAGGPTAEGGSLVVSSGRFQIVNHPATPRDGNLVVTQSGWKIPEGFVPAGRSGIGTTLRRADGDPVPSLGYFAVDRFSEGDFGSLELGGVVEFRGPVDIAASRRLSVADGGVIYANDAVSLAAPYVKLGTTFLGPLGLKDPARAAAFHLGDAFYFPPTHGPGRLTVRAGLIDIGNLALQHIGDARLFADDIRGDGSFEMAGDLFLRAGQIYPASATSFTIAADDYRARDFAPGDDLLPGSVTIAAGGDRPLPLSAGGELDIYAARITQGGTLRAPLGRIDLGWDGSGDAPKSLISGRRFAVTGRLTLSAGGETSVAAVDRNGAGAIIPYGIVADGDTWIDPLGVDITGGGLPAKEINLGARNLTTQAGSVIDLRGGGDLYAYHWVDGQGGTRDILASNDSFAVIPGYEASQAPFAPNNLTTDAGLLGGDPGYVNAGLRVGDRIHLTAGGGWPEGDYTLLPARYALLPGALLVTPQGGAPADAVTLPDGSSVVSGYRFNGLDAGPGRPRVYAPFEVATSDVVRARAEYEDAFANVFLGDSARRLDRPVPRLPVDSGHLVFQAVDSLTLRGGVTAASPANGIGAYIDISSPVDILIDGGETRPGAAKGALVLNAAELSAFDAESLLIGGVRHSGEGGSTVDVNTGRITVDNAGAPLSGPEIILAATQGLTLAPGAEIASSGAMRAPAETLSVAGDGALLRLSSDPAAAIERSDLAAPTDAKLTVGRGATLTGTSLILDSSDATVLDPGARLLAANVALDSGRIVLRLGGADGLPSTGALVLSGSALRDLQGVDSLSLLSYSSIDVYGSGHVTVNGALSLHAAELRGFGPDDRRVTFAASEILIDNSAGGARPGPASPATGTLAFDAGIIRLGAGTVKIDQFARLDLNASDHVFLADSGQLVTQGDLDVRTPFVEAGSSVRQKIAAAGALRLLAPVGDVSAPTAPGLGASLQLQGTSVLANSDVYLPGGQLGIRATTGDLSVGGRLDVGGSRANFYDLAPSTGGGRIDLTASRGSVTLARSGVLSVAADPFGGDAGTLTINTPNGRVDLAGTLLGQGGAQGLDGSFSLDVRTLADTTALDRRLNAADFTESRRLRVRRGDVFVGGLAHAHEFLLSADAGSITVGGSIDASGERGGVIGLSASGSLVLTSTADLTVAADQFDAAGKGGAISLAAGSEIDGVIDPAALLDLRRGAMIDLGVAAQTPASAAAGDFSGTLHLRAPQLADGSDLRLAAIDATIRGASSIEAEGYKLFDLTPSDPAAPAATITTAIQNAVKASGVAFLGDGAVETAAYAAMHDRLLAHNARLDSLFTIRAGAELINRTGDLLLGSANSDGFGNWNLQTDRFGPRRAPGVLTLRAKGDLVFNNALQDGFDVANAGRAYLAPLLAANPLLPVNAQSWSFHLTAGADLGAADYRRVLALPRLADGKGSLLLGKNAVLATAGAGDDGTIRDALGAGGKYYQVIRTGSGDIDISAGRDVLFRNQFAAIYTAGTLVDDATLNGRFDLPIPSDNGISSYYPPQYSLAGGDVSIFAQNDISHVTLLNGATEPVDDSSRQLPMNWLMRRGFVDPATGQFGRAIYGDIASTTWWVNFSNFFEGVGALGGGNVSLFAGRDVKNIDAVAPTNARLPIGRPDASRLVELGGGDVRVRSGRDIDGGVYYAERGDIALDAGRVITTNATRSPSLTILTTEDPLPAATWLPTTLFLGRGNAFVQALGDVLLGPTVNAFLLPGGLTNTFWYKTYFSTYGPETAVNVTSVGGSVTLRESATLPTDSGPLPILQTWLRNVMVLNAKTAAYYHPWIRLNETDVDSFDLAASLLPPTLRVSALSGDIDLVGDLTLSPAARGTLDLVASGAINGLQPNGELTDLDGPVTAWSSSRVNLSDANPAAIPGVATPFAYQSLVGAVPSAGISGFQFLSFIDNLFAETGSLATVLQTKQSLHGRELLHAGDPDPLHLYAREGDITGLTLFAGKSARIVAGNDISDIAFYLQNVADRDVSVVSAGRDIVAYNANTPSRTAAQAAGNILNIGESPLAGDIQLGGPGALEVLAGRDLDLGTGANNADGTGTGIVTIGNARNPYLPFDGASLTIGAGVGPSHGLAGSALDFDAFIDTYVRGPAGERYFASLSADGGNEALTLAAFESLAPDAQRRAALDVFYRVLRDTGRDYNDPSSARYRDLSAYQAGYDAIDTLFGAGPFQGEIKTESRDIRTKSGGDLTIFAPGGGLELAAGNPDEAPLAPPGIITETGGNVSIFTDGDVDIGVGRIFTLRGGDLVIWSSHGDIAAGSASKTVASAPPTRVLIDPQSADVETDLAGLSTGGGIGVLATVAGVPPGFVDLVAPVGVVDAGDAGIRATGGVNIAAEAVLNAGNITSPSVAGVPTVAPVAAPNLAGLTSANTTAGAANSAANDLANQARQPPAPEEMPSTITVEVLGYGGSEDSARAAIPRDGA